MIEKHTIIDILASTPGLSNHELILKFGKYFSVKSVSTVEPVQGIPHLIFKIRNKLWMNQKREHYHSKISGNTAIMGDVCVKEISAYQSWPVPCSSTSQVRKPQLLSANKISVSRASLESHRYIVFEHYSAEKSCQSSNQSKADTGKLLTWWIKTYSKGLRSHICLFYCR